MAFLTQGEVSSGVRVGPARVSSCRQCKYTSCCLLIHSISLPLLPMSMALKLLRPTSRAIVQSVLLSKSQYRPFVSLTTQHTVPRPSRAPTASIVSKRSVTQAAMNGEAQEIKEEDVAGWKKRAPYRIHEKNEDFNALYEASCHCGTVKYQLSREIPLDSKLCHCTTCQTQHGMSDLSAYDATCQRGPLADIAASL